MNLRKERKKQKVHKIKKAGKDTPSSGEKSKVQFLSVRTKMISIFMVLIILMICLSIANYNKAKGAIADTYVENKVQTFNAMGNYMDLIFDDISTQSLRILVSKGMEKFYSEVYKDNKITRLEAKNEVTGAILDTINTDKFISGICIIAENDVGFTSVSSKNIDANFYTELMSSEEGKVLEGLTAKESWIGLHTFVDEKLSQNQTTYGVSLVRRLSDVITGASGYMIVDVNYEVIKNLLTEQVGEKEVMAFISQDGREILSNRKEAMFTATDFYRESLSNEKGYGTKYVKYDGDSYLYTYSKIGDSGNMLCSIVPQNVIYKSADSIKQTAFILVLLSGIVAIIIASFYSRGFSRAIKAIVHGLGKAAKGDLTTTINLKRNDEFGDLSLNVNSMLGNMKNLISKTAIVGTEVTESTLLVYRSSEEMKESMREISTAVEEIEQGIMEQSICANSCLEQMNLLADKINEVSDSTNRISKVEENTKMILEENYQSVQNLYDKAKETAEITGRIVLDMDKLSSQSGSIAQIITSIEDIASQSSLLSLNASIEAARAGESGRGFAVVAQEIGKLAMQSLDAAKHVKQIAEGISEQTQETASTVMTAQEAVSEQTSALDTTMNGFKGISEQTQELMKQLEKIKAEVYAIENVKQDTLGAISDISAVSEQSAAATREVAAKTSQQLQNVEKLNEVIVKLEEKAKTLEGEIGVFKV
ncbi:MAG TPA: methyl-accepting chemotaxis protein [Lachnospiraceae bacterium]|nr:methyl-accepting chemotaxis protein [Lachnospiraceae bacterium]